MIKLLLSVLLLAVGCSSSGPVTKKCAVHKHHQDRLYQVKIANLPINQRWYLKRDALELAEKLANDKKCLL